MALNFKNIQDKLSKLSSKVKAKSSDGEEIEVEIIEDSASDQNEKTITEKVDLSELQKKKPRLKSIQILIIILLALFLLIDDEWLGNKDIPIVTKEPENTNKAPEPDVTNEVPIPESELVEPSNTEEVVDSTGSESNLDMEVTTNEPEPVPSPVPDEVPTFTETPEITDSSEIEESKQKLENADLTENVVMEETGIPSTKDSDLNTNDSDMTANETGKAISEMSDEEVLSKVNSGGPSEKEAEFNEIEVANEIIESNGADKLLSQIEQELKQEKMLQKDLDYKIKNRPAPLYSSRGPALVRNCVDGHWACIDAPAYKQCKMNLQWTKDKGRKIQCYPHEVFATLKDCELAQDKIMEDSLKGLEVCQN